VSASEPARTSTTAAAAGAALGTSAGFRPRQEPPYLVGLPSSGSAALGYGALIVPTGTAKGLGLPRLGPGAAVRGAAEPDLFALLGLPDFLREGRAAATRRAGNPLADVDGVLGQQATLTDVGDGGGLRFGHLPLLALTLVLFSSLLVVGAVVPPGLIARTPLAPAEYARFREPMALAAIGILVPVAVVALVVALS
jgi:hypothetical protein